MSLNRVDIIGHLGQDPELRSFGNGNKVCNLRVAVSETWKDKNSGERKERTEWVTVAVFAEHAVRYAETYLRKGSKVFVTGKLETRKWQDQSGADRYSTEVVVRPFGGELQGLDKPGGEQRQERREGPQRQASGGAYAGGADLGDEIPFAPEWRG